MTSELQDAVALADEMLEVGAPRLIPRFTHWCPIVDAPINEHDVALIQCRCYTSKEFFAAQDVLAVQLDSLRVPGEQ